MQLTESEMWNFKMSKWFLWPNQNKAVSYHKTAQCLISSSSVWDSGDRWESLTQFIRYLLFQMLPGKLYDNELQIMEAKTSESVDI